MLELLSEAEPAALQHLGPSERSATGSDAAAPETPAKSVQPPPASVTINKKRKPVEDHGLPRLNNYFALEDSETMGAMFRATNALDYEVCVGGIEVVIVADTFISEDSEQGASRRRIDDYQRVFIYVRDATAPGADKDGYVRVEDSEALLRGRARVLSLLKELFLTLCSRIWTRAAGYILASLRRNWGDDEEIGNDVFPKEAWNNYCTVRREGTLGLYDSLSKLYLGYINNAAHGFAYSARSFYETKQSSFMIDVLDKEKKHTTRLLAFRHRDMKPRIWFVRHEELKSGGGGGGTAAEVGTRGGGVASAPRVVVTEITIDDDDDEKEKKAEESEEGGVEDEGDFAATPKKRPVQSAATPTPAPKREKRKEHDKKDKSKKEKSQQRATAAAAAARKRDREEREKLEEQRREEATVRAADEELQRAVANAEKKQKAAHVPVAEVSCGSRPTGAPPSVAPPPPPPRKHALPSNFFGEPRYRVYQVMDGKGEASVPARFAVQDTRSKVITNRTFYTEELNNVRPPVVALLRVNGCHEQIPAFLADMKTFVRDSDYFHFELVTDEDGYIPQDAGMAMVRYARDKPLELLTGAKLGTYVDDVALLCELRGIDPTAVRAAYKKLSSVSHRG